MKHTKLIFLIVALFSFALLEACKNDSDEPKPNVVFTVKADYLFSSNSDNWFGVWTSDGTLIDFKKYTFGDSLEFISPTEINGKITVGIFWESTKLPLLGSKVTFLTDVEPGSTFTRDIKKTHSIVPSSSFRVNMDPPLDFDGSLMMSSSYGWLATAYAGDNFDISFDSRTAKYLLVYRMGDVAKYKLLNNVKSKDLIELTPSDFVPFEKQITFNVPSNVEGGGYMLRAYDENVSYSAAGYKWGSVFDIDETRFGFTTGYSIDEGSLDPGPATITAGYPGSFNKLISEIYLIIDNGNTYVHYKKTGAAPGTIKWPDPTKFTYSGESPYDVKLTTTENVQYIKSVWASEAGTQWVILSPGLAPTLPTIPEDFLKENPTFAHKPASVFDFYRSSMTAHLGPRTYGQMLADFMNDNFDTEMEEMKVVITKD